MMPSTIEPPAHCCISLPGNVSKKLPEPYQSFEGFGELPKELRLFIWEYARLVPRVVHLTLMNPKPKSDGFAGSEEQRAYLRQSHYTNCPSLLLACRESYELVSKDYQPELSPPPASCNNDASQKPPTVYRTLFDFSLDTLYLRHDMLGMHNTFEFYRHSDMFGTVNSLNLRFILSDLKELHNAEQPVLVKTENLAILAGKCNRNLSDPLVLRRLIRILKIFPNLKTLTIVVEHYESQSHSTNPYHSNLTLINPIDVEETIKAYELQILVLDFPEPEVIELEIPHLKKYLGTINIHDLKEADQEELERFKRKGFKLRWTLNIPEFECKIAVDGQSRARLDAARLRCEAAFAKHGHELDEGVMDSWDRHCMKWRSLS